MLDCQNPASPVLLVVVLAEIHDPSIVEKGGSMLGCIQSIESARTHYHGLMYHFISIQKQSTSDSWMLATNGTL